MGLSTNKRISIFGSIAFFSLICIASVYAYFYPDDTFFATTASIFAMMFPMLYYSGKWGKEVRQKHIIIQILIMLFIPAIRIGIITYRWYAGFPSFTTVANPTAAFLIVWAESFVWLLIGIMFVIGIYHTDEIVDKVKQIFGK